MLNVVFGSGLVVGVGLLAIVMAPLLEVATRVIA